MADHDTPAVADAADDAFECAVGVLIRMAGHARVQASKFLQRCTDEEILAFATCEDGPTFAALMDQVFDRLEQRLPVAEVVIEAAMALREAANRISEATADPNYTNAEPVASDALDVQDE